MRRVVAAVALAAALPLAAQPAAAPTPLPVQPPVTGPEEAALFEALGRREGLERLTDDFVDRLLVDPQIGHFFKGIRPAHLKQQLPDFFCMLLGGGCVYEGDTMRRSHADLGVARADFLRLVELLQQSMDARRIPFPVQNRLLARLAPMHREIVTR